MKTSQYKHQISLKLLTWNIVAVMITLSVQSFGQGRRSELSQMIDEDRTTIEVIAGYDKNIQNHILQVSQTPEVFNKIEQLQKRSQDQFKAIIAGYDQETQGAFYDLARYPNLITDLVTNGRPTRSQTDRIVSNYPLDIHETAQKYAPQYYDVLLRIDRLNNEIDGEFKRVLEPYNQRTRESVNVLIGYPEVVSALVDDLEFTALLGNVYREDPEWVMGRLDQISRELADQNREDLEAYKNNIQKDPEAYNELLDASEKFAREKNEVRYIDSSEPIIDIRFNNCYPYWFGYPYWYPEPYWRPRPLYYHTGFYRNHYGNIVFMGLPSSFFLHWQTHYHPRWFPHLSYNYYNFYENHYMKRYRESPHAFPHHGFYRSIESYVINNPRVNNSRLVQIDHQRGANIVRQPNAMDSRTIRRGNTGISRQNGPSGSRQGTGISGTNGSGNRRQYNAVRPGNSEGPYNQRGSVPRNSSIRRGTTSAPSSQGGNATGRSQLKSAGNNSFYVRPRSGDAPTNRTREKGSATFTPRSSSTNAGNRATVRQRPTAPQVNSSAPAPTERTGRSVGAKEAVRSEKPAAPQQRANAQTAVKQSGSSVRSETRAAATPRETRREVRERKSAARSNPGGSSKTEGNNGKRR